MVVALCSVAWAEYFKANNIDFVFFSAAAAQARLDADEKTRHAQADHEAKEAGKRTKEAELAAKARKHGDKEAGTSKDKEKEKEATEALRTVAEAGSEDDRTAEKRAARFDVLPSDEDEGQAEPAQPRPAVEEPTTTTAATAAARTETKGDSDGSAPAKPKNAAAEQKQTTDSATQPAKERAQSLSVPIDPAAVLTREQLLAMLFANAPDHARARTVTPAASDGKDKDGEDKEPAKDDDRRVRIGMVGYPNVGKSSTINALFGSKKVIVSATPGKTKHFQVCSFHCVSL